MSYALSFCLALALCFTGQWMAWRGFGPALKNESNYFSSLARIQSGSQSPPAAIFLLGSSLTGRFPDRHAGFKGVANLGCDGGSAADTLRAIDLGRLPTPEFLIIEGNTLYRAAGAPPTEISRAMEAPWFQVGSRIPMLSAAARPAGFAYGKLLATRIGRAQGPGVPPLPVASEPTTSFSEQIILSSEEDLLVAELAAILHRYQQSGGKAIVVFLPPGAPVESPNRRIGLALAMRSGCAWWDLTDGLPSGSVRFTDGVHMDARSAAATLDVLLDGLGKGP